MQKYLMVLDPLPAWVRFNHANGEVRENARAQVPNLISANGCNWKCDPDSCHAHRSFKYLFDIFGCLFDPVRIHIRRYSETFLNPSYFDNPPSPDTMDSSSKAVKLVAACYAHAGLKRIDPCLHW